MRIETFLKKHKAWEEARWGLQWMYVASTVILLCMRHKLVHRLICLVFDSLAWVHSYYHFSTELQKKTKQQQHCTGHTHKQEHGRYIPKSETNDLSLASLNALGQSDSL